MEEFIIKYLSDISDVIKKTKQIQSFNKAAAQQIGKDFNSAVNVMSRSLDKIKEVSIKIDGQPAVKSIETVNTVVKDAEGRFVRLSTVTTKVGEEVKNIAKTFTLLKTPISQAEKEAAKMLGTSSKLATNFSNLSNINRNFAKHLKGIGEASRFLGTTLKTTSDNGSRTTKIFETANGRFVQLTETVKRLANGQQQVSRTVKEMNKAQLANITTIESGKLVTRGFADNLKTLLQRAALTIPVWFAIRNGIGLVFRTISDGLKNLVEFERALEKIKRNVQGTGDEVAASLGVARKEITALAIETGKSTVEIANAVKQFTTIGFSIEDSLALATTATKASVLLFEDAGKTAEAFARSFVVLQDTSKGAKTTQEQFNEAIALTVKLGEKNADNLGEINEALLKSASSAKLAGLSMNELIVLLQTLATAGRTGSQAGTLLSTSLNELLGNLDKLAPQLGVVVEKGDTAFKVLGKILDASDRLANSDLIQDRANLVEAFSDIFGGERGTKIIGSLATVNKLFKENAKVIPDIGEFNGKVDDLTQTVPLLVDRIGILNQELGKAFVTGIVGGEDFQKTLQGIIGVQENVLKGAEGMGITFRNAFLIGGVSSIIIFRAELVKLAAFLSTKLGVAAPIAIGLFGLGEIEKNLKALPDQIGAANVAVEQAGSKVFQQLLKGFKKELNKDELSQLISDIEVIGAAQLGFDEATLARALDRLKVELEITKAKEAQTQATEKQNQVLDKESRDVLLKDAQERLKAEGALESQLIKQELALRNQLNLKLQGAELLDKQLQLERAINQEQRLRTDLSGETIKLFKIAQSEGVGVAKAIGEALSGQIDFNDFIRRGGRQVEVFKDQFADIFENEQAKAFFKGSARVPGLPGLRGGAGIDIQENAIRRGTRTNDPQVALRERLAKESLAHKDATVKNTTALEEVNLSLDELRTAFQNGQTLQGLDARNFVSGNQNIQNVANRVAPQAQTLRIDVNVDGRNLSLVGTPERIRELAAQLGTEVGRAVEQKLVNDIANNPQSPGAKAVTKRQLET